MNRLSLQDDFRGAVLKLADRNPGATIALAQMVFQGRSIDPDAAAPELVLYQLDDLGIYGGDIWKLYKDLCGGNVARTLGVLRAVQLGFLDRRDLRAAIDGRAALCIDNLLAAVRRELPAFAADGAGA